MTTSQSRNLRKAGAVALSLALAMSTLAITPASAAKKVKLAKTKITVNVGKTKTVKIKNVKKKQVKKLTVKSSKKSVAKAKASNKTAIKVTGKKKGSAKVTANLKLKKKVGGKKAYKMTLKVTVKKAATPVEPTTAPSAAPTPVISGSAISIEKAKYEVATGASVDVVAKLTPETSNEDVVWTIDDTTKATVSGQSATVNGVATATIVGLEIGTTNINASIGGGKIKTSAQLEVTKNKIVAKIVDVKQTKANAFDLTFDIDTKTDSEGFGKDKIKVDAKGKTGSHVIPVTAIKQSADGKVVSCTLNAAFDDKDQVTVSYADTSKDFVASVGDPVSGNILTTTAQKDVPTKVEYALYDAAGIDVTSKLGSDEDNRVKIEISEDKAGTNAELDSASKAKITMTVLDGTATLTLKYTKVGNTTSKPDITNSVSVKCVPTQATLGTFHFKGGKDGLKYLGDDDTVAKFYKGSDLSEATVSLGDDDGDTFWFYAQGEDGKAIEYDTYEAEPGNKNVCGVSVDKTAGKYGQVTITGYKEDKTVINVACEKYGVKAYYQIPVVVKKAATVNSFRISTDRSTMSNSNDGRYYANISFTAKDSNDADVAPESIDYEIERPKGYNPADTVIAEGYVVNPENASVDEHGIFTAHMAPTGTYKVKATAQFPGEDKARTATTEIKVTALTKEAYGEYAGNTGLTKVDYKVELGKTYGGAPVKSIKNYLAEATTVRLAAYTGTSFVGYVGAGGQVGGGAYIETSQQIIEVGFGISKGGKYANAFTTGAFTTDSRPVKTANLFGLSKDNPKFTTGAASAEINEFDYDAEEWQYGKDDSVCSSAGTYTITYRYKKIVKDGDGYAIANDYTNATTTFTVTDELKGDMPTVTATSFNVGGSDATSIIEVLTTNVDLNNNKGENASITNVIGKNGSPVEAGQSTVYAKYVVVQENAISYYVSLGQSFTVA